MSDAAGKLDDKVSDKLSDRGQAWLNATSKAINAEILVAAGGGPLTKLSAGSDRISLPTVGSVGELKDCVPLEAKLNPVSYQVSPKFLRRALSLGDHIAFGKTTIRVYGTDLVHVVSIGL